jgi:hypothetical protein
MYDVIITINLDITAFSTVTQECLGTIMQRGLISENFRIAARRTSISNHYEYKVFLPFLVQSPWNLGTQIKTLLDSKLH